jgi:hypothetical protein
LGTARKPDLKMLEEQKYRADGDTPLLNRMNDLFGV